MNTRIPLVVAGIIFLLVALAHLLRLVVHFTIMAAGYALPMTVSYVGFVIALVLAIWMFLAALKK